MNGREWRIWIYGGGTALPSARRDNTFLGLEAGDACWLIDCGASPYQRLLRSGLSPLELRGVILTHSHADHLYGLPVLLFQLALAGYTGLLTVYGLAATLEVARRVVESFALGEHCARHCWQVVEDGADIVVESSPGSSGMVRVREVCHSRPTLGLRLSGPGGWTVAYSADTEPCPADISLAQGADWLLHECTVAQSFPGHSTPEGVGRLAAAANVSRLGIVHYDPLYTVEESVLLARIRESGFGGPVYVLGELDAIGAGQPRYS